MRILFYFLFISLTVLSCNNSGKKKDTVPDIPVIDSLRAKAMEDSANAVRDTILLKETSRALGYIKNKNYDSLSAMAHPAEGVRFSPYGFIDTAHDKVIYAATMASWADKKKRTRVLWGTVDPTDEPINMTIDSYIKRYVYDVDFLRADSVKVNEFIGGGNSLNNLLDVYKGCNFVECHFPGFDKKFDGMDWRSVRLVYKLLDGKYYLVAIVHDEWTI